MSLPDLPTTAPTLLGPVPVAVVDAIHEDGRRGEWDGMHRSIRVLSSLALPVQWQTLGHELAHAILDDSAAQHVLTERQTEIVCDAVGTWLAAAVAAGRVVLK
jgi:hypothetical protein